MGLPVQVVVLLSGSCTCCCRQLILSSLCRALREVPVQTVEELDLNSVLVLLAPHMG